MINLQQMLEDRKNIYLIGMMGSGKSTVGKMVASKTNMHFLDSDKIIEENAGKSVSEIFSNYGENKFRELERDFIRNGHPKNNCIVSCGGGVCMIDGIMKSMKSMGLVVCLWAEPETIYNRIKNDNNRPLLQVQDPLNEIVAIINSRRNTYLMADYVIKTDDLKTDGVAQEIIVANNKLNQCRKS